MKINIKSFNKYEIIARDYDIDDNKKKFRY